MFSTTVLLLLLLMVAGFLRFYRLKERGVLFWDDGLRLSELQYFEDLLNFITKNFSALKSKKMFLKEAEPRFRGLYLNDTNH